MKKLSEYCQRVPCAACEGKGYTISTGTHWDMGEDGEPIATPEPVQEPCQSCDCTGEVYIVPSNLLEELEKQMEELRDLL